MRWDQPSSPPQAFRDLSTDTYLNLLYLVTYRVCIFTTSSAERLWNISSKVDFIMEKAPRDVSTNTSIITWTRTVSTQDSNLFIDRGTQTDGQILSTRCSFATRCPTFQESFRLIPVHRIILISQFTCETSSSRASKQGMIPSQMFLQILSMYSETGGNMNESSNRSSEPSTGNIRPFPRQKRYKYKRVALSRTRDYISESAFVPPTVCCVPGRILLNNPTILLRRQDLTQASRLLEVTLIYPRVG